MSGTVLLASVCGALVIGGLLLAAHALTAPEAPARPPRRRWRAATPADPRGARRQQVLWGAAAAVAAGVWLASGWPVGGALAGGAVVGVPWLLAQFAGGNAAVERLEALQEWVRRA